MINVIPNESRRNRVSPSINGSNAMLNMVNKQVWEARLHGLLDNHLKSFKNSYEPEDGIIQFDWEEKIWAFMHCFEAFARKQFAFFVDGFENNKLQTHSDYLPESVFNIVIDQIGYDIGVIEKIARQRRGRYAAPLKRADCLVLAAMQLAATHKLLDPNKMPAVLTYFQKSTSIRVIPYAPVILVGIPYSCMHNNRDLLAIPHEVGHYVYRMGKRGQSSILQWASGRVEQWNRAHRLEEAFPKWAKGWIEEIFADVYGALVGGLVMAQDFQDLQKQRTRRQFFTDDGSHPVPLLRPYIYINTLLKADPKKEHQWVSLLKKAWDDHLKGETLAFKTRDEVGCEQAVEMSEVITQGDFMDAGQKQIDYMIDAIMTDLLPEKTFGDWANDSLVDAEYPLDADALADVLYRGFDVFVASPRSCDDLSTLQISDEDVMLNGDKIYNRGDTGLHMDDTRNRLKNLRANPTKEEYIGTDGQGGWLRVLDAGGWAVKGPRCEGTGTCG